MQVQRLALISNTFHYIKIISVPMNTKVPLCALLHRFNQYEHEQELIRKELIEGVFGGLMNENTPYEKILTYHDSEEEVSSEQQMCDKLSEHRKHSQHMKRLTLESPVDLKPFVLIIGCFLFYRFPF